MKKEKLTRTKSTWYGRPLSRTEVLYFTYLGDERQAVLFAKLLPLPENASHADIEDAVTRVLVKVKTVLGGDANVEYLGGQRRDTLRVH